MISEDQLNQLAKWSNRSREDLMLLKDAPHGFSLEDAFQLMQQARQSRLDCAFIYAELVGG